jgi:hypothetical protein
VHTIRNKYGYSICIGKIQVGPENGSRADGVRIVTHPLSDPLCKLGFYVHAREMCADRDFYFL